MGRLLSRKEIGRMNPAKLKIVTLQGTARQRGLAYGEECRSWIAETIGRWKAELGKGVEIDPDVYIARFLGDTRFLPAVERWTPGLLVELRALAEAAGQSFETMLAYHLNDELWWHQRDLHPGILTRVGDRCTALGVQRQGDIPPMIAQNLDVPWLFDGTQVVLHIKYPDSQLEVLSFAFVGALGVNGMNNMGVAQVQNTLLQLDHNLGGLPVSFVSRGILEQTSLRDAVGFVKGVSHASGQNYVLGSPDGVVDVECSGKHVVEFLPYAGATPVYHTNHPLVNDDLGQFRAALEKLPADQR
jgi:isopenicillin-N N-acyltransferase like protein